METVRGRAWTKRRAADYPARAVSARSRIEDEYRRFPRAFWLLWSLVIVSRSGAFLFPFLMLFLTTRRGLSMEAAGSALSLYGAGSICAVLLGGQLADHWGRRATVLLSLFGGAFAIVAVGVAPAHGAIFAATFVFGLFGEMYRPALAASVSDLVAPHDHRAAFGYLYWAHNLGFAIAPATAGLVTWHFGFRAAFAVNVATLLLCGAWAWRALPESRPVHRDAAGGGLAQQLAALRDPRLLLFLCAFAPLPLLLLQTVSVLPVLIRDDGLGAAAFGWILSFNGLLIVLLQPWLIARFEALPRTLVLTVGALCLGCGFAAHAIADTTTEHVLALMLWTLGEIATVPMAAGMVAELAPLEQRGRYQGAYGITWSFAHFAGPTVAAFALAQAGITGWAVACVGAGVLSAALYGVFAAREARR